MALFIDTANLDEIREIVKWGVISGVTTNPKIVTRESGISLKERILEICDIVDGPISVELINENIEDMIKEAEEYSSWHKNIVIKVPMGAAELEVVNILEMGKNIRTNVTAIMAANQVLLAAFAGATYVSLFVGRIGDMGYDSFEIVAETKSMLVKQGLSSKIIVGSIRHLIDINRSVLAGADIITVPYKFFKQMATNPKTIETINEFNSAWKNMREKGLIRM